MAHGTGSAHSLHGRFRGGWVVALLFLLSFSTSAVFATDLSLPDTSNARRSLFTGITDPLPSTHYEERTVLVSPRGEAVLYRTEEQNGNDYFLFLNAQGEEFPLVGPGNYVVRRRRDDGEFTQIKVFLQGNEGSFLRVRPSGLRSTMDIFLAGVRIYHDVPTPFDMQQILTLPVETLTRSVAAMVDWSLFSVDPDREGYRVIASMVATLRGELPELSDAEDGAMDRSGEIVFIESLLPQEEEAGFNCSGFAKWVVDGLYSPRTGTLLSIESLEEKNLDIRGTRWSQPREDDRDPYFGLDWTRNLAAFMNPGTGPEENDVRSVPFSRYIEDVGYPVEDLPAILHRLAQLEPGTLYLGSVNRSYGEGTVLRQHTHVVVFLPYFDSEGSFHPVVMERNVETSLESLANRYAGDYIHLVRIPAEGKFELPAIQD